MPRNPKGTKRPYIQPSFEEVDASAAKARPRVTGEPEDPGVQTLLSVANEKLQEGTNRAGQQSCDFCPRT